MTAYRFFDTPYRAIEMSKVNLLAVDSLLMTFIGQIIPRNEAISTHVLKEYEVAVTIKRDDEIHPVVSGNKWRKLKYHLQAAKDSGSKGFLTYGGAFSNHIAATAFAATEKGLQSIGIIRGERIEPLNPTLAAAQSRGMQLHFVGRSAYRSDKRRLAQEVDPHGEFHLIPEGGADSAGVKGCEEILSQDDKTMFDIIACSAGTGTTAAGLCRSMGSGQKLRVYPALKGDFLRNEISILSKGLNIERLWISNDYHFGGYAKTSPELFEFMRAFYADTGIKTDPIYTAKMLYGLLDDIRKGTIERGSRILAIHTGGLQGLKGIELREGIRIFQ